MKVWLVLGTCLVTAGLSYCLWYAAVGSCPSYKSEVRRASRQRRVEDYCTSKYTELPEQLKCIDSMEAK